MSTNTATVKGTCQFTFKAVLQNKEEVAAIIKRDYERALLKDPKDRSQRDHVLVAANGDFEQVMQAAIKIALRNTVFDVNDDEAFQVGRGSIKTTFEPR